MFALVTDAFGGTGGIAQYNRDFLKAFSEASQNNSVVVLPRLAEESIHGSPPNVEQQCPKKGRLSYVLSAFIALNSKGQFDLIFCGHLHFAPLGILLARLYRLPMWLQLHGIEAWQKTSNVLRWAAEQASLVTCVSRYTRRRFLNWANVSPHRVRVVPNTIRGLFTPGPKAEYLLERYNLHGKKVLLTVARLSAAERYKGQDKVISVLPDLLKKHPDLIYVIVGDGDDRPRLDELARILGVERLVRFVGRVEEKELVDLYRTAEIFVMPSTGEGFGIVFLEAMACGIPVIGGNQGGSTDSLHDGMLGAVVADDKLCEAIEDMLTIGPRDSEKLSNSVEHYFGKQAFCYQVARLSSTCAAKNFHA